MKLISELRSSSATWFEVLTKRGTHMLMLSVLELQSSLLLVVDEPWLDPKELLQQGPFSSLTQIFSPLIKVIWLTTWSLKKNWNLYIQKIKHVKESSMS